MGMIQNVSRQPAGAKANEQPVLSLYNCQNMFITGCFALPGTNTFIQIEGENALDISVKGNDLNNAKDPVKILNTSTSRVRSDNLKKLPV